MNINEAEIQLQQHGVKPTAVRLVVWKCIAGKECAFSLKDVEEWLPEMDRSSIFRALRLFTDHHLLHEIDDGSGQCKYCLCRCHNDEHRGHVHFTCSQCGTTYCLADILIPAVALPQGFHIHETEYVVKGTCPKCR